MTGKNMEDIGLGHPYSPSGEPLFKESIVGILPI